MLRFGRSPGNWATRQRREFRGQQRPQSNQTDNWRCTDQREATCNTSHMFNIFVIIQMLFVIRRHSGDHHVWKSTLLETRASQWPQFCFADLGDWWAYWNNGIKCLSWHTWNQYRNALAPQMFSLNQTLNSDSDLNPVKPLLSYLNVYIVERLITNAKWVYLATNQMDIVNAHVIARSWTVYECKYVYKYFLCPVQWNTICRLTENLVTLM